MQMNKERIPVSDKLDEVVKKNMEILRREQRVKRLRKAAAGMGAAAACFMGVLAVGTANPAWASQIPIIGHIFDQMGENLNYPGDYSQKGNALETEKAGETAAEEPAGKAALADGQNQEEQKEGETEGTVISASKEDTAYTKTVNGVTVTLSEVYSNGQALNIALALQSKEPFPDTRRGQDGKALISCLTSETYSFSSEPQTHQIDLDGKFTDEYTFAGVMRIDLNTAGEGDETSDTIPESFSMDLTIDQIIGELANPEVRDMGVSQEELEAMPEEEWRDLMERLNEEDPSWSRYPNEHENYWYDGPWEFTLEVYQDLEGCVTVEVGTNEDGIGFEKIVKTPYEITMYPADPRPQEEIMETGLSYFPVMLDADGMLMSSGSGGSVNTVAVGDHDVSQVDVYLFEELKWLDEIKGFWWNNEEELKAGGTLEDGRTFKELCDDTCVFHQTVTIPDR